MVLRFDPKRQVALWSQDGRFRIVVSLGDVAGSFPHFKQLDDYAFISTRASDDEFVKHHGYAAGPLARRGLAARKSGWKS